MDFKDLVDNIYIREDLSKKMKLKLLSCIWVDIKENKQSENKQWLGYVRNLIESLR